MRRRSRRGSVIVETVLCMLVLMPLLLGTMVIGVNLARAIQVNQFSRDVGHLYAYGIDFKLAGNQNLLTHLAQGLNVQTSGGNGVIIFSNVTFVAEQDCTAGGLEGNSSSCPNLGQAVITRRFVVGNSSLLTSHFGTPPGGDIDSNGYIKPAYYLTHPSDRATGFADIMTIASGQVAWVTEVFVAAPDLDIPGFMRGTGTYAYNIF